MLYNTRELKNHCRHIYSIIFTMYACIIPSPFYSTISNFFFLSYISLILTPLWGPYGLFRVILSFLARCIHHCLLCCRLSLIAEDVVVAVLVLVQHSRIYDHEPTSSKLVSHRANLIGLRSLSLSWFFLFDDSFPLFGRLCVDRATCFEGSKSSFKCKFFIVLEKILV